MAPCAAAGCRKQRKSPPCFGAGQTVGEDVAQAVEILPGVKMALFEILKGGEIQAKPVRV